MRFAFLYDQHQTSVRPECPPWRAYRGTSTTLSLCHPERSEGSGLTTSETAQRALARVSDPPERPGDFFRLRRVTFGNSSKSNQKSRPRSLRPLIAKRTSAMRGRRHRGNVLWLLSCVKKVTRHQGGTALSISRQMVCAQARTQRFQSVGLVPRYTCLRGHSGRTDFGVVHAESALSPIRNRGRAQSNHFPPFAFHSFNAASVFSTWWSGLRSV